MRLRKFLGDLVYLYIKTSTYWLASQTDAHKLVLTKAKASHLEYHYENYAISLKAPETSL